MLWGPGMHVPTPSRRGVWVVLEGLLAHLF